MWNELCMTVGRTTTKMNAHFVPQFFICLQAVNTHGVSFIEFISPVIYNRSSSI